MSFYFPFWTIGRKIFTPVFSCSCCEVQQSIYIKFFKILSFVRSQWWESRWGDPSLRMLVIGLRPPRQFWVEPWLEPSSSLLNWSRLTLTSLCLWVFSVSQVFFCVRDIQNQVPPCSVHSFFKAYVTVHFSLHGIVPVYIFCSGILHNNSFSLSLSPVLDWGGTRSLCMQSTRKDSTRKLFPQLPFTLKWKRTLLSVLAWMVNYIVTPWESPAVFLQEALLMSTLLSAAFCADHPLHYKLTYIT
jgi:hypothetical protein